MTRSNYPKFRILVFPLLLLVVICFMFATPAKDFLYNKKADTATVLKDSAMPVMHEHKSLSQFAYLYDQMNLDSLGLSQSAFDYALQGYNDLVSNGQLKNDHILSIVDFSLPSTKKRLFVIDMSNGKLLFNTYVSHGRNSGKEMATAFSNDANSFKSSLGFYVTGSTYSGEHGYSLRLDGKEAGINDNAYSRDIVMHAANYVNESIIKAKGLLGRSLGCPAVPVVLHKAIINTIKDGTCLFLYSPDSFYITHSKMITQQLAGDTAV